MKQVHFTAVSTALSVVLLGSSLFTSPHVVAAEERGHWTLSYQQIKVDGFESTVGDLDIGETDTQSLNFEISYRITDRTTLYAGIPLVRKRYTGNFPHRPDTLVPARSDDFVDDGDYHTDFQDFLLGVSHVVYSEDLTVEPFLFYGLPSHDYAHFGHAAVGQNLWKLELGTRLTYKPPLSDFYFRFDPSYVFVEETLGTSIDHWKALAEVGYHFGGGRVGRLFVLTKQGDGLEFPDDFPPPRTTEAWYQHDRMVRHNYTNVGIGFDWSVGAKTSVSTSAFTMVQEEQVHILEYAFSVGISRSF